MLSTFTLWQFRDDNFNDDNLKLTKIVNFKLPPIVPLGVLSIGDIMIASEQSIDPLVGPEVVLEFMSDDGQLD